MQEAPQPSIIIPLSAPLRAPNWWVLALWAQGDRWDGVCGRGTAQASGGRQGASVGGERGCGMAWAMLQGSTFLLKYTRQCPGQPSFLNHWLAHKPSVILSGLCSLPELWQDFLGHLIRGLLWRIRGEHVILMSPHFRWRAEEEKKAYSQIDHLAQGFHGLFLHYMLWQNYNVPIHYPFTHSALAIKSLIFSCAPCTQEPVSHFPLQLVLAN